MNRIEAIITCLVILALAGGSPPARAQEQTPAGSIETQAAVPDDLTFSHFFLQDPMTSTANWHSHTVVDGSGGVHLAFYDGNYIYYAHCTANCGDPANWLELPLFAVGEEDSLDEPTLGVDANGHPRLMWYALYSGYERYYYYAECNANCANNSANWSMVGVVQVNWYAYPNNVRYAALNSQGQPRLVYPMRNYPDYGFYYLTCDTGCTTASHWFTTTVTTPNLEPDIFQLVFDPNGRPRVLGYDSNNGELVYAECNSGCTTAANWGSVGLFGPIYYLSEYPFVLRVDAQGRPRIAYYDGNANNNVLYYAWSNASPLSVGGWSSYTLNYPTNDYWSLDLAIDRQGRPRVAYPTAIIQGSPDGMSYLTCTANCETTSPTWQQQFIETSDDLNTSYPIALNPDCVSSSWMLVGYPSLALGVADNPNVSYRALHIQLCYDIYGNLKPLYDAQSIRFATASSMPQNNKWLYLPLVIR
jgi:hypothetical protein